jgi:hypothetical protein
MDTEIKVNLSTTTQPIEQVEIPVTIVEILEKDGKRYLWDEDSVSWVEAVVPE